jgi:hypothetical protein
VASLQASLSAQVLHPHLDLTALIGDVNRLVCESSPTAFFASLFYAEYENYFSRLRLRKRNEGRSHLLRLSLPRVNLYWIIRLHRFTNHCAKVTARVDTPLFSRSENRSRSSHTFPIPSPIAHLQVRTGIHARISGLFLQTYEAMSDASSGGENGPPGWKAHYIAELSWGRENQKTLQLPIWV